MNRRKWLFTTLFTLPLAIAGSMIYANSRSRGYTCPLTGEQLPCEKCCPLNQKEQQAEAKPYVCPLTGEELPCPKCCPLNQKK
jgi:hypothetical protein